MRNLSYFVFYLSVVGLGISLLAVPANAMEIVQIPGDAPNLTTAISIVPDGGVIEMAGGTYTAPVGAFQIVNVGKTFTIRAAPGATVVLDGAGNRNILHYINTVVDLGGPVIFEGLTFRNGFSTTDQRAGGVTVVRANATFIDCIFEDNGSEAPNSGGGGASVTVDSHATFIGCEFRDNFAKNEGGALKVGEARSVVHRCVFENNSTAIPNHRSSSTGGAVSLTQGEMVVSNSRFVGNVAGYTGGALYALGFWTAPFSEPLTLLTVVNSTFIDNVAESHPTVVPVAPEEGGAVHAEDQTTLRIYNSRFDENHAVKGGGVSSYRADVEIHSSIFRGNTAFATGNEKGNGGAIKSNGNDTNIDGATNLPTARLVVTDSFIQGRFGSTGNAAQVGGGIFATGDVNRQYGFGGVPVQPNFALNRSEVVIDNVAFVDTDVQINPLSTATGFGGGIFGSLVDLTVTNSLFLNNDATGTEGRGGGCMILTESAIDISDSGFFNNSAVFAGAALFLEGSDASIDSNIFAENDFSPGDPEVDGFSRGAAIYASPMLGANLANMTGTVSNNDFSRQVGLPIYDDDRCEAANDLRYNGNLFHNTTFGDAVYKDRLDTFAGQNVAYLNSLVVTRTGAAPCPLPSTNKSQVANTFVGGAPVLGKIVGAPLEIHVNTAEGDPDPTTDAYAAYGWSGGAATVNSSSVSGNWGSVEVGTGVHTLQVAGQQFTAGVGSGLNPSASFTAIPQSISSGESSTLSYLRNSGTFLVADIDQGLLEMGGADGAVAVTPPATSTYNLVWVAEEGGLDLQATVFVDEVPLAIFTDDFESGDFSAWSTTTP